jgi:hypothetical protein
VAQEIRRRWKSASTVFAVREIDAISGHRAFSDVHEIFPEDCDDGVNDARANVTD